MRFLVIPLLATVVTVLSPAPVQADLGDQLSKLLAKDGAEGDNFGWAVAIDSSIAIVGARKGNNDGGIDSGSAYLIDISDPANPVQFGELLASDGAASDFFGYSVALDGTIAIVGAWGHDDNGSSSGSAYLFDISDLANPVQTAELLPSDGEAVAHFGISVAISGTTVIVGAHRDNENGEDSGSAYLYDISDPANPVQIAKLLANDGASCDFFGQSVAIKAGIAIVGAYLDDDNGSSSGSAYLFFSISTKSRTSGSDTVRVMEFQGSGSD